MLKEGERGKRTDVAGSSVSFHIHQHPLEHFGAWMVGQIKSQPAQVDGVRA
jgi:hypothetical protein